MRARCILAALLFAAPLARAQECGCAPAAFPAKWTVYATTGAALLEVASTNAHLGAAGLPSVSNDAMGFGIGALYAAGPLRFGAEYLWLDAGRESTSSGLSVRLASTQAVLLLGYSLFRLKGVSIVPTFGVGHATQRLVIGDRAGGATPAPTPPPTFDEVLVSPGRSSRLDGGQWMWESLIAVDAVVPTRPGAEWGVTLGARAGYRLGPNRPEWEYRGKATSGGSVDQATGPVVRLIIGFGRR